MPLMEMRSFNPGIEAAQQRGMLAMQSGAAPQSPQGAAPVAAVGADPAAAGDAAAGAAGVMPEPPDPKKIILGSVIRGAATGASMMFGLNSFGSKIPFINNFMGTTGIKVIRMLPFLSKATWPMGALIALGAGAVVGGIAGLVGGVIKTRKAAAEYVQAQQQAAAQQPVGDPLVLGPDGKPVAIDPNTGIPVAGPGQPGTRAKKKPRKNPVMADDHKATAKRGAKESAHAKGADGAHCAKDGAGQLYRIRRGDTLWALARRHDTTVGAIVAANSGKIKDPDLIYAGDKIRIPGKD